MNLRAKPSSRERASVIAYFVMAVVIIGSIGGLYGYAIHNLGLAQRRQDLVAAYHLAESGAALACADLERAGTNTALGLAAALQALPAPYAVNDALSSATELVLERAIAAPFTNQSVIARIALTNAPDSSSGRINAFTQVGNVRQSVFSHAELGFGWGAAVLSDSPGDGSTAATRLAAGAGNVVFVGGSSGPLVIDGGVFANGRINTSGGQFTARPGVGSIRAGQRVAPSLAMSCLSTASEIPDWTANGAADQLFQINRLMAVARASGNYFSNLSGFISAAAGGATLEGVVGVDVSKADFPMLAATNLPSGINIRGTLVFNLSSEFAPTDKLIIATPLNINAAPLAGLVPANPMTYPSGFPATFANPAKNPVNVDITAAGFANFSAGDDLPALVCNAASLCLQSDANISGVVFCPNLVEITTKADGQTQFLRGSVISGGGVYVENLRAATTIISHEPTALDSLAVSRKQGRCVRVVYRE
jgi:hypothetical protein